MNSEKWIKEKVISKQLITIDDYKDYSKSDFKYINIKNRRKYYV
ncbi:hypothetical protein [Aliarcobacter butzleri]|nr:hypothetical protein [Aliarcobacter butzleri]